MTTALLLFLTQQVGNIHIPEQHDILLLLWQVAWCDKLRVDSLRAELQSAQQILKLPQIEDVLGNIFFAS